MHEPQHILVIRLSAMGDVAMTVPVIRAFVKQNPDVKITVLSKAFLKPIFDDIPHVNFYSADVSGIHKGLIGLKKLSGELLKLNIDAVADLHNVLRSKILRFFLSFSINKIEVIDKGRSEKKALTRKDNKVFKQLRSTHERYADVFRKLGFDIDLDKAYFTPKKILSNESKKFLDLKKTAIGIAPFAQYDSKVYPLDLMEKVIENLSKLPDVQILLFGGGKKESEILLRIEKKFDNTVSLAGKTGFEKELEIISNLDLMLSMDSANAHLAAMFGVKTITLWGATHPFTGFAPYRQPLRYCLTPDLKKYPKLPCSVYGNKVCDGYKEVMRSILPETVIKTVENVLFR